MQSEMFDSSESFKGSAADPAPNVETRECKSCKGSGKSDYSRDGNCTLCRGARVLAAPDVPYILRAIAGRKGLRTAAPDHYGKAYTLANVRAYYVWRLARFHGGADVTMPITAETLIHGDPWRAELERIAELVAKRAFGTHMAAAYRWAGALGHSVNVPDGMPATAYSCGPVADSNKPDFELPELY